MVSLSDKVDHAATLDAVEEKEVSVRWILVGYGL